MWQVAVFKFNVNGWRIHSSYAISPFQNPGLAVDENKKRMYLIANFKQKLRSGQYCKSPHKLIDFVNSYERKDK